MRSRAIAVAGLLLLSGCGGTVLGDGSVKLGDQVRMIPAGADETGCPVFRMSSGGRAALRLPFYRTMGGDFSTNRAEAECRP